MRPEREMPHGPVARPDIGGAGRTEVPNADRGDDVENTAVKPGNLIANLKYASRCHQKVDVWRRGGEEHDGGERRERSRGPSQSSSFHRGCVTGAAEVQCLQRARAEHERSSVETQTLNDILRATDRLHLLDSVVDRTGDVVDADSRVSTSRMTIRAGNSPWLRCDARAQRDLGGGVRSSEHLFSERVLIDAAGVVKCRRTAPCNYNYN
mmetsp:Transcript_3689/g.14185  ORF Transcript_3689/g.14185 Transcript_3689/m.14185 type:complete len:209 (-) Transcript_3689:14-640(-)